MKGLAGGLAACQVFGDQAGGAGFLPGQAQLLQAVGLRLQASPTGELGKGSIER